MVRAERLAAIVRGLACALAVGACLGLFTPQRATANEAAPLSADPALEARVVRVAAELRCLVCQNQTIADSQADLAVDLRNQVREMLRRGDSEAKIIDYMTERYGDFVLYRPPLKSTTAVLWFAPALMLVGGVLLLLLILRRRNRMSADHFDADLAEDEPASAAQPPSPSSSSSR